MNSDSCGVEGESVPCVPVARADRLAFDVGYRSFQIDSTANATSLGTVNSRSMASELLFTLRLYDPLRRWRD